MQEVPENFFTVAGTAATNAANSGVVTAIFRPIVFFESIAELQAYLSIQPANTAADPYYIALNIADLGGNYNTVGSLGYALRVNGTKYVSLDLSGSTITSIPYGAFWYNASCITLTNIIIPDSVTIIWGVAFRDCTSLTSIIIPDSVTKIESAAFYRCSNLASITIGNSVAFIGNEAFYKCSSLTSITIPNSVTEIGSWYNNPTNITLGNIGSWAFYQCTSLTSVTIGNGITNLVGFEGCTSLTNVTIPNSVTSIGDGAFRYTGLASVTIPASVTSIGHEAFRYTNLTSVTFQGPISWDIYNRIDAGYTFPGNAYGMYDAYYAGGGIGTYTRPINGYAWRKQ